MQHINKFIDVKLLDDEIKKIESMRQELKRKNALLRTRLTRLKKISIDLKQGDLFGTEKDD